MHPAAPWLPYHPPICVGSLHLLSTQVCLASPSIVAHSRHIDTDPPVSDPPKHHCFTSPPFYHRLHPSGLHFSTDVRQHFGNGRSPSIQYLPPRVPVTLGSSIPAPVAQISFIPQFLKDIPNLNSPDLSSSSDSESPDSRNDHASLPMDYGLRGSPSEDAKSYSDLIQQMASKLSLLVSKPQLAVDSVVFDIVWWELPSAVGPPLTNVML